MNLDLVVIQLKALREEYYAMRFDAIDDNDDELWVHYNNFSNGLSQAIRVIEENSTNSNTLDLAVIQLEALYEKYKALKNQDVDYAIVTDNYREYRDICKGIAKAIRVIEENSTNSNTREQE